MCARVCVCTYVCGVFVGLCVCVCQRDYTRKHTPLRLCVCALGYIFASLSLNVVAFSRLLILTNPPTHTPPRSLPTDPAGSADDWLLTRCFSLHAACWSLALQKLLKVKPCFLLAFPNCCDETHVG